MKIQDLALNTKNTWCPGCTNFGIEAAFKMAVAELMEEGEKLENFVVVTGIGCNAKIADYLKLNTLYTLHGRPVPAATGIKLANPNLKVIVFEGDGDAYDEGIEHLIHAAKKNTNITVIVHNNRLFALTTGQFTATSPKGFIGRSTPQGSTEEPFNPLALMLAGKASFVARGYALKTNHLKDLIKKGIKNEGFSFIDVLQPCISYFNNIEFYNQKVYELEGMNHDYKNFDKAWEKAREWDYGKDAEKIPIGLFYSSFRPSYESFVEEREKPKSISTILSARI
ncbi:MAG: thiamine pyrophosphate-dependent enzyme [Candidatus Pacebacteria bacterium]|nr:thiamine pyrophosphate-dependent enzyme [Candidatus Paceibacterota bacterium]